MDIYRVVFFTGPAQKVLSVEDCKIPNKKVRVGLAFPFLLGHSLQYFNPLILFCISLLIHVTLSTRFSFQHMRFDEMLIIWQKVHLIMAQLLAELSCNL